MQVERRMRAGVVAPIHLLHPSSQSSRMELCLYKGDVEGEKPSALLRMILGCVKLFEMDSEWRLNSNG